MCVCMYARTMYVHIYCIHTYILLCVYMCTSVMYPKWMPEGALLLLLLLPHPQRAWMMLSRSLSLSLSLSLMDEWMG